MPRLLFSKTGTAVWISHLDLMRALQRGFRRAGVLLKHSQGYSPHPTLSIALPLSVGVSSAYELADFELEDGASVSLKELTERLNQSLPKGIQVLSCYENGQKLKHLKWLEAEITLEYDAGVPENTAQQIEALFARPSLSVEKHSKNGPVLVDIIPMLHHLTVAQPSDTTLRLTATVSAQNPTLNPLLLVTAIETELPDCKPIFSKCHRLMLYDESSSKFT